MNLFENLTTKYYSTNNIKSSFNPEGRRISMPIICDIKDTVAVVTLSDNGKYETAFGFSSLAKARANAEKNKNGKYAFYKLHTKREDCSKSLKGDLISICTRKN